MHGVAGEAAVPELIGALALVEGRGAAATRLARALGCTGMSVYLPTEGAGATAPADLAGAGETDRAGRALGDGGPGGLVPAPGLADPLGGAAEGPAFLQRCATAGEHFQVLDTGNGVPLSIRGVRSEGAVFVVTGAACGGADLEALRPLLPLLHRLLAAELRGVATASAAAPSSAGAERVEAIERRAAEAAAEAKAEFLAMMSHELRTPLNAIIGYTELLDLGVSGPLNPQQTSHLERVRASSRHLLSLINDILDLARIEAGHMSVLQEPADAAGVVADAVALLLPHAEQRGVELVTACTGEHPFIGDADRARQVLSNIVSNALKFTPPGGSVTVHCDAEQQAPTGSRLSSDGPWTRIDVVDNGIGMSSAELAAAFQPFVQAERGTRRVHGGTGLGLTISRQLARLMGGDVTAVSEPGEGSTFTFWLPTRAAGAGQLDDSIRVRSR
jgi:signal transduction histidine kinase